MAKKPEIQADALLNLVLDQDSLTRQLKTALGTSVKEAASAAQLGNELVSPKNLQQIRQKLQKTFADASKDLGEAMNVAQSDGLRAILDKTRRDTVKKFERDINDLMTGKGRAATRSLPALPALGKELDELKTALKVFGADSLRSGSYQQRAPEIQRAVRNAEQLNKVMTELAGIPAVAAKDLQKIRSLVNDKDTGRYLRMQADERKNLARSGQALSLQTQTLSRLAGTLTKMGFGDAAAEIKAANQARAALVSEFNKVTSPKAVEERARRETLASQKAEAADTKRDRQALAREVRRREKEQQALGTVQTVIGARRAGQPSRGLLAAMSPEERARAGYKPREDYRALSLRELQQNRARSGQGALDNWFASRQGPVARMNPLEEIRQNIARAAAAGAAKASTAKVRDDRAALDNWFASRQGAVARSTPLDDVRQNIARAAAANAAREQQQRQKEMQVYNDAIRKDGDRMLALRAASQERIRKAAEKQAEQQAREEEKRETARLDSIAKARIKAERKAMAREEAARRAGGIYTPAGFESSRRQYGTASFGTIAASGPSAERDANRAAMLRLLAARRDDTPLRLADISQRGQIATLQALRDQNARQEREAAARRAAQPPVPPGGAGGGGGKEPQEFSSTGRLLSQFGRYAVGYGSLYQLLGLVTQLKTEIIELDRAFYSIKAVTQATDREMRGISRSIREVALNTNFTTREIAQATEILGQAGVMPADMGKVLSSTAQFASATNSSLSVAADLMTTVRTVFKEMDESTIADQLTRAINLSKLTAEDLKTILSLTSQTAASYNVNLEQLLGSVTTLRNAGVKPSTVATGLRQAMLEIFNPDTATIKALGARYGAMGEEMDAGAIQQRFFGFTNAANPLIAALSELKRLGFADEGQKTLQRGVDIRAFNAIQALISNFKELEAAENKITFGQAAAEGSRVQMESLSASLENLGASVVVLAEQLSNGLVRQLANGAKEATNLIERLSELDIELKAQGKDGVGSMFQGAFAGGALGLLASKGMGFKGRAAATLAGGVAGGYMAAPSEANSEGLGAGDIAGIVGTVTFLGSLLFGIARKFKPVVQAAKAAENSGLGKKALGILDVVGGDDSGKGGWGNRISTLLSLVTGVGLAMTALDSVFDLMPGAETEKLRAQAEAAAQRASKASAALSKNRTMVEAYDVNAVNPKEGTTAAAFGKYDEMLGDFQLNMADAFGDVAVSQASGLETLVKEYANTPFSRRDEVRARIDELLGRSSAEVTDKVLFDLGMQAESMESAVGGLVEGTRQTITAVTERIREARANGGEITAADQAMSQAFSEQSEVLRGILDGTNQLDSTETKQRLEEFFARFVELIDETPKLEAEQRSALMLSLRQEMINALALSDNSAEISAAVVQISNSLEFMGLSVAQRLDSISSALNARRTQLQAEIAELEGQAPGVFKRFGSWLTTPIGQNDPELEAQEKARQAEISRRQAQMAAIDRESEIQTQKAFEREKQLLEENAEFRRQAANRAQSLVGGLVGDADVQKVLRNPAMLRDAGVTASQAKLVSDNLDALTGGDASALLKRLGESSRTDKEGKLVPGTEYEKFNKLAELLAANAARMTKAEERRLRDEKNMVTGDLLQRQTAAETAIKKAGYGKDFSLLTSDSPDNPVRQLFATQREILTKELAQAKAAADDAVADDSKTQIAKQQKVIETQAKLDTLDMEMEQELDKFRAKAKGAAETAKRKADAEAKKQAQIAVTQTGIEQRIIKQDFDEAIRVGDVEAFRQKSAEYVAVQEKLRAQLEDELKARGYNASQILDEIKLREDLNKPLAEQVENIRKLAAQRQQMRDLEFRDIGSGPNLGGKENTAYLGAEGFTREEMAAADMRDIIRLRQQRAMVMEDLSLPELQGDEETIQNLRKEIEDLDTQIGTTRANLEQITMSADQAIYKAFSPRNLMIELENTQYSYQQLGNNLRGGLVSALDSAGDALARMVAEGGDFKDVMSDIIFQLAQEELSMMFKTNLREGAAGLTELFAGDKTVGEVGSGFMKNIFGFGGTDDAKAAGAGGASDALGGLLGTASDSLTSTMNVQAGVVNVNGAGGAAEGVAKLFDGGGQGEAANALKGAADVLSTEVPAAVGDGVKTESQGFFGSMGSSLMGMFSSVMSFITGIFTQQAASDAASSASGGGGMGGGLGSLFGGNAASGAGEVSAGGPSGGGAVVTGPGGGAVPAGGGGSWGGAVGGAFGGAMLGNALGGALGGKKGSKWGTVLGALAGAYFGFGMAGGGRITKSGMVVGPGKKGVDSVPVTIKGTNENGLLAPGESVLNTRATDALGADWIDAANSGKLFRKAVGGVLDASYNASKRAQASASNSVAASSATVGTPEAPQVNVKNVNVFDPGEIQSALQSRQGEDVIINLLKKRGAIK